MRYVTLLVLILVGCATTSGYPIVEEDTNLYRVCMAFCKERDSNTYGVEARRVTDDVVLCTCRNNRGDIKQYISVKSYQAQENADVQVEVLKP